MRRRNPAAALAASPTMVGAVTTLIVIVAVFLAYNANNGLPFVPVYRVSVEVPNAARIGNNNEIRIGGTRVGIIESIEPVVNEADQTDGAERKRRDGGQPARGRRPPQPEARQDRRAAAEGLGLPRPLPLQLRPQVPGDRARHRRGRARGIRLQRPQRRDGRTRTSSAATCRPTRRPSRETIPEQAKDGCFTPQTEFDAIANTFDTKTREAGPPEPGRLRQRVRRPRDVAERRDRGAQPAVREPRPGLEGPRRPRDGPAPVLRRAGRHRADRRAGLRAAGPVLHERGDRVRGDLVRPERAPGDDLRGPADAPDRDRHAAAAASVPGRAGGALAAPAPGRAAASDRAAEPEQRRAGRHPGADADAGAQPRPAPDPDRAAPARRPAAARSSRSSASS